MILDTSICTEFDFGVDFDGQNGQKYQKIMIFQYLHENLNQKVDSISERVPECDFEGPGPQNPQKIPTFSKFY